MAPNDRLARYAARLLVESLNQRFESQFDITDTAGDAFVAADGAHRLGVYVAPLWEVDEASDDRRCSMEERLGAGNVRGPFLLWVPPGAQVPVEEPDASDFVQRVQVAAGPLPPGARTEVRFPVTVKLAKMRVEGGYASVIGGMSRWWTRITEKVNGTFHVDSSAVHRLTLDGEGRERLWENIGALSHGLDVGQAADFEVEEAWTLQRLAASETEHGFAIAGAPPGPDPTEGIAVRRTARKRLAAANEALAALDVELRAVGLIGAYEYAELEGAGATVKALDPSLFSKLQVVSVLADGDVRPTFLPRELPWQT
jgi:hypothetical protein